MKPISDPALLEQLEAAPIEPVSDPDLIRRLEGVAPAEPSPSLIDRATGGAKRIGSAVARGAGEGFGDTEADPLGVDRDVLPLQNDALDPVRFQINGIIKQLSAVLDTAARGTNAAIKGGAAGAGQVAQELGQSQGEAARLERDLIGMADTAAIMGGAPRPSASSTATATVEKAASGGRQAAIEAAERLEVPVPRGVAGSRAEQIVAGSLAELPVVGSPLQKASKTAIDKLDDTRAGIADELGSASVKAAGDAVKDEVVNWIKTVSKDEAAAIFDPLDKIVGDAKGPLSRTSVAAQSLLKEAAESGLAPPAIIGQLKKALDMPGGLSYRAMQRLRTEIGDRISGDIVPEPGMSKRALKAIYAGLSDDLEFLVGKAGGAKGKEAWRTANEKFKTEIASRRDALAKIVGVDGNASPEAVVERLYTMASAKRGADLDRLIQARSTVGEASWKELGSALVARLGNTKDGFSAAQFRTDWHKLSDAGKEALFSPEHRQVLDDIATVAGEFETLQKLGNPSGSGRMATITGAAALAFHNPLLLLQSAVGAYGLSRILAQPVTAKAAEGWARAYVNAAKDLTTENYQALKRAGLDLRSEMDRAGIPATARLAVVGSQTPRNEESEDEQDD